MDRELSYDTRWEQSRPIGLVLDSRTSVCLVRALRHGEIRLSEPANNQLPEMLLSTNAEDPTLGGEDRMPHQNCDAVEPAVLDHKIATGKVVGSGPTDGTRHRTLSIGNHIAPSPSAALPNRARQEARRDVFRDWNREHSPLRVQTQRELTGARLAQPEVLTSANFGRGGNEDRN